jgi:hypothetical protein
MLLHERLHCSHKQIVVPGILPSGPSLADETAGKVVGVFELLSLAVVELKANWTAGHSARINNKNENACVFYLKEGLE